MPSLSHTGQFVGYFVASNVFAALTVYPVLQHSPTFYAAAVQLSEGVSILVLANWLVAIAVVLGKALQTVLFGELRLIELEHIYERSRFTVLNSLFALTMFSNDYLLVPGFLTLILLFVKVFHWILKDRYESVFQRATRPSDIVMTRNTFTLLLLLYVDFSMAYSCAQYTFSNNSDVYFAFGFEFAILFLDLFAEGVKIALNTWEVVYLNRHPQEEVMESKGLYMKILDITHTTLNLIIHIFLLFTFIGPYRFPIYLFKDIFINTLNLVKQIQELNRYRRASKELDTRLDDATEEDLSDDNNLCIICRDDMTTEGVRKGERLFPKKLQCGHIIHMGCLKGWFERSQVCPMCRAPVFGQSRPPSANRQQQPQNINEQPQNNNDDLGAPPFMNQHPPHGSDFFNAPRANTPQPTATTNTNTPGIQPANESDILLLPHNALCPPDWTLMKLSNGNPTRDEYTLHLSSRHVAKVEKVYLDPVGRAHGIRFRQGTSDPESAEE